MALYEFKQEAVRSRLPNPTVFRWSAPTAALLILLAAAVQIIGMPFSLECRIVSGMGIPSPACAETILLSLPPSSSDPCDPMDLALALRGLSMLGPSLILLPETTNPTPEQAGLLNSVKARLRELGIPLFETAKDISSTAYRPVPICRYSPSWCTQEPKIHEPAGSAPADGTMRFPTARHEEEGKLTLLARNRTGELLGTVWWDGLMKGQPSAPVWMLADRFLILPNHDVMAIDGGCVTVHQGKSPRTVPFEDFLLRMEERERGTLSPRFDELWHGAVVVVSSGEDLPSVTKLASLRETFCRGSLSVTGQILSSVLLSMMTFAAFLTRGTVRNILTVMIVAGVGIASAWILFQGIMPPLLPWLTAILLNGFSLLIQGRKSTG